MIQNNCMQNDTVGRMSHFNPFSLDRFVCASNIQFLNLNFVLLFQVRRKQTVPLMENAHWIKVLSLQSLAPLERPDQNRFINSLTLNLMEMDRLRLRQHKKVKSRKDSSSAFFEKLFRWAMVKIPSEEKHTKTNNFWIYVNWINVHKEDWRKTVEYRDKWAEIFHSSYALISALFCTYSTIVSHSVNRFWLPRH